MRGSSSIFDGIPLTSGDDGDLGDNHAEFITFESHTLNGNRGIAGIILRKGPQIE